MNLRYGNVVRNIITGHTPETENVVLFTLSQKNQRALL